MTFELDQFAASLARAAGGFAETFMTAASPGIVSTTMLRAEDNPDYPRDEDYVMALGHELKKEYDAIIASGHLLQIDAPDLAMERQFMFQGRPLDEFLERVALHIRALNVAVADIPAEKVRLHVCFGNWTAPTSTTATWLRCCPCSTRPGSARSASPAPTRATSTSGRRSRPTRRPRP